MIRWDLGFYCLNRYIMGNTILQRIPDYDAISKFEIRLCDPIYDALFRSTCLRQTGDVTKIPV